MLSTASKEVVCVQPQAGMMFLPPVLRAAVVVHVRRTWFQMMRLPIRWVRLSFLLCFMHLHFSNTPLKS